MWQRQPLLSPEEGAALISVLKETVKRLDIGEATESSRPNVFDDDMVLAALLLRCRSSILFICS